MARELEPDLALILQNAPLKSILNHLSTDCSSPLIVSTDRNHCILGKDEIHLYSGRGQWKEHGPWVRELDADAISFNYIFYEPEQFI